jgi:hypothetical protein
MLTKEEILHRKVLATVGILPIVNDLLTDLVHDYPQVFKQQLKKALNDARKAIDKNQDNIFSDQELDKAERAEQLNSISISFEKWLNDNF